MSELHHAFALEIGRVEHDEGNVAMQRRKIMRFDGDEPPGCEITGDVGAHEEAEACAPQHQLARRSFRQFDGCIGAADEAQLALGLDLPPAQRNDSRADRQHIVERRAGRQAGGERRGEGERHWFAHDDQWRQVADQRVEIWPAHDAQRRDPFVQQRHHLFLPALAHDDVEIGKARLQPQQRIRQQRRHHGTERGDDQSPALDPAQRLTPLVNARQDAPRIGQESHALIGQCNAPPAREQHRPELVLEHAHAHRNRRLGHVEPRRRASEAEVAGHAVEGQQLINIHQKLLC